MNPDDRGQQALVAVATAIQAEAATHDPGIAALDLAGIGWATVELERAARELGPELGIEPSDWVIAARDTLLGARAWRAFDSDPSRPAVVLLEPDTEGRLAATLARFGEGVAAVYLRPSGTDGPAWWAAAAKTGRGSSGPLGPARLLAGGATWGPHVILLEARLEAGSEAEGPEPAIRADAA